MANETTHTSKETLNVSLVESKKDYEPLWLEEYRDCFTFQYMPVTQLFIERLSSDFVSWARDDKKATRLEDFMLLKGIHPATFYRWCDKYEILAEALETARALIASRRFHRAEEKKTSEKIFMFTQHQYDKKWADAERYHADMRQEEENKAHVFNINFNKPEIVTAEQLKLEVDKTRE